MEQSIFEEQQERILEEAKQKALLKLEEETVPKESIWIEEGIGQLANDASLQIRAEVEDELLELSASDLLVTGGIPNEHGAQCTKTE